jgi:hypothetical protein
MNQKVNSASLVQRDPYLFIIFFQKFVTATLMFVPAIKTNFEFTKWLLTQPLLAPLKGRPDTTAIAKAISSLWSQRGAEQQEKIDYLIEQFIANYSNYSASHRAEKVRHLLHTDMLHMYFDVDLLDRSFNGQKLIDIVGDPQISSCASCFFRALDSHVDRETVKKIWPDETSIPKMVTATINTPLRATAFNWLKEEKLLMKVFDSPLVQSSIILQHLRESYENEEVLHLAEQLVEEGFDVRVQPINWGGVLEEKMLSVLSDMKITRKILDFLWSKFPSQVPNLLIGIISNRKGKQLLPRFLLEFAESMPKEYRSDFLKNNSKATLWHIIAKYTLVDNVHIVKVLLKLLEITGKLVHFIPFLESFSFSPQANFYNTLRVRHKCS